MLTGYLYLGGHLKPDPYLRAAKVLETHGKEVAEHVASFEARQIQDVQELIRYHDIDCEFEETMVSDVCLDEAGSLKTGQALSRVVAAGVSTAKAIERSCGAEAERVRREPLGAAEPAKTGANTKVDVRGARRQIVPQV